MEDSCDADCGELDSITGNASASAKVPDVVIPNKDTTTIGCHCGCQAMHKIRKVEDSVTPAISILRLATRAANKGKVNAPMMPEAMKELASILALIVSKPAC